MSNPSQNNEHVLKAEKAMADPRGADARLQGEAADILAGSKTQGSTTKDTQGSVASDKPMLKGGTEKWSDGIDHGDKYEHQFDNIKLPVSAKDISKEDTKSYPEAQPSYNEKGKLDHIDFKPVKDK